MKDNAASKDSAVGIVYKTGAGSGPNAVAPMWESGVSVIRDEVTEAKKGWIIFTMITLSDFAVVRAGAYSLFQTQLEA